MLTLLQTGKNRKKKNKVDLKKGSREGKEGKKEKSKKKLFKIFAREQAIGKERQETIIF
jgi:hypothetical protein